VENPPLIKSPFYMLHTIPEFIDDVASYKLLFSSGISLFATFDTGG
jgi:hypothetical protein